MEVDGEEEADEAGERGGESSFAFSFLQKSFTALCHTFPLSFLLTLCMSRMKFLSYPFALGSVFLFFLWFLRLSRRCCRLPCWLLTLSSDESTISGSESESATSSAEAASRLVITVVLWVAVVTICVGVDEEEEEVVMTVVVVEEEEDDLVVFVVDAVVLVAGAGFALLALAEGEEAEVAEAGGASKTPRHSGHPASPRAARNTAQSSHTALAQQRLGRSAGEAPSITM